MTKSFNILFTCSGRRVALMEAFRAALAELNIPGKIIATDSSEASSALQLADVGLVAPRVSDDGYVSWLLDACRDNEVSLVVPLTDLDLIILADSCDRFVRQGTTVMVGSGDIIRACRNKALTASLLEASSLPFVKTVTKSEFEKEPFYPCFAKPADGSASFGAARIDDEDQLRRHISKFEDRSSSDVIMQEYLDGAEYTIDVYRKRDGQVISVVPRQRLQVRSGEVEKALAVKNDILIDLGISVSDVLDGLWGVFCIQCRMSDAMRPMVFEINPRFGGGVPLSIKAGANLPLYLIQEILSLEILPKVGQFTDNLLMLRYDQAFFSTIAPGVKIEGMDKPIII